MSAPVDVLAVMDAEIRELPRMASAIEFAGAKYGWKCDPEEAIRRLSEARAAVAELIDAVDAGDPDSFGQILFYEREGDRLLAALARVKGGAA